MGQNARLSSHRRPERTGRTTPELLGALLAALALGACQPSLDEIASGFTVDPRVRPALAEDGTVAAAEPTHLLVGRNATSLTTIDLAPFALTLAAFEPERALQVRAAGGVVSDLVLVANRTGIAGCAGAGRGAYRLDGSGGSLTTLLEGCVADIPTSGGVGPEIALSPNGTVAFSTIVDGKGALQRGPVAGPVAVLRSGTGEFYNTGSVDVNDAGRVIAQMEYFDGFAGGLMRAVLAFDTPEQAKLTLYTAVEKLGIGAQPAIAINNAGTVAVAMNDPFTMNIGGTSYPFAAGVYRATPTLFNTPKALTLVADLSGLYCRFGNVDIDEAGDVVFEAVLDGSADCGPVTTTVHQDGIFTGPDPTVGAVIRRGDAALGGHQYFDSVVLGQINAARQVSFITTYSEPLVDPVKVWRRNP